MTIKATAIFAACVMLATASAGHAAGKGETRMERATFAGGCFWCMEPPFEKTAGVTEVISGYTGGNKADPTYEEVSSGATGHLEAVRMKFDPAKVTYEALLEIYWRNIDPTNPIGQFADRGEQYKPAIFYHNEAQKRLAEESKQRLQASGKFKKPIVVEIRKAEEFYPAEDYHQDFYKKNAEHYKRYRFGSGREGFLEKTWGAEEVPSPTKK